MDINAAYSFDVIVVGAGPGGTTVASLLANAGKRVLLADKNGKPGGRMLTINRDGFAYELFPINCVPCRNSAFERLSKELGKEKLVKPIYNDETGGVGTLLFESKDGVIYTLSMHGGFSPQMMSDLGAKNEEDFKNVADMFRRFATMPESEIEQLYNISAMDYMDGIKGIPAGVYTFFLATFGEGMFEMSSDKVPAAEMIKMFQQVIKNGGGRYYENGVGYFFEVMAKTVEEKGGKLLMHTRIASINVADGKVCGVTTDIGIKYTAPVVISNAGIRQTVLKLVGEMHFNEQYAEKVKGYESNLACVGYRYFTNKPVLKETSLIYFPEGCTSKFEEFEKMAGGKTKPERNYIYIGTTSLYPGCAPKDKQLIYAVMSCSADPGINVQPYLDYIEEKARKILPELYDGCIERTEIMSPVHVPTVGNDSIFAGQGGESYGIANSIGQSGQDRPKGDTPVTGLYIVGNDAAGFGLGTHQAVDSGFRVFEMIK